MPLEKYFKGSGSTMKEYGAKKGKRVFYASAQKQHMMPMSKLPKSVKQSPSGDLGQHRQIEAKVAGGFKGVKSVSASSYFKGR